MSLSFYFGFIVWFWICLRGICRKWVAESGIRCVFSIIGLKMTKMCLKSKALLVHWNGWLHCDLAWCPFMLILRFLSSLWCCLAFFFFRDIKMMCLSLSFASPVFFFIIVLLCYVCVFNSAFLSLGLDLNKMEAAGCTYSKTCTIHASSSKPASLWVFYGTKTHNSKPPSHQVSQHWHRSLSLTQSQLSPETKGFEF